MINNNITQRYDYGNNDQEFVFTFKSRPFAVLVSSILPTPTSSYIDHLLVMELGLKMSEIQCKKVSFAGKKLRLLGKISCTVQCVIDGRIMGNFHLKASVIENLNQHFDTHCIAGVQTAALLRGDQVHSSPTSSGPPSPARGTPSRRRTSPAPSRSTSSPTSATRRPSSPPGFPPRPLFSTQQQVAPSMPINFAAITAEKMDPFETNIKILSSTFNDADLELGPNSEIAALDDIHEEGEVDIEENRVKVFTTIEGWVYRTGHGRDKCTKVDCVDNVRCGTISNNCGFHPQWFLPRGFQYCGQMCRGAFCPCLQTSQNGYYG